MRETLHFLEYASVTSGRVCKAGFEPRVRFSLEREEV